MGSVPFSYLAPPPSQSAFRMSLRARLLAAAVALAPVLSFAADKPNIVVVVVDGLGDLATPLGGANEVLPDPEIRARLTPNLDRLAKLGATFTHAQAVDTLEPPEVVSLGRRAGSLLQRLKKAAYAISQTGLPPAKAAGWETRPFSQRAAAPHRVEQGPKFGDGQRLWSRLVPIAKGRADDLSIEAWERLTDSLDDQLAAAWAAERITTSDAADTSQLLLVQLDGVHLPLEAPGVFFDRFPLDTITLPPTPASPPAGLSPALRAVMLLLGPLSEDDHRAALQAYLACVSRVDFALGKVLDAVETVNADDQNKNDWALVFVSKRGFQLGQHGAWGPVGVGEAAANVNLMIYAPGVSTAAQRLDTPVSVADLAATLVGLPGVELTTTISRNLLPLVDLKGGRPGAVAVTTAGELATSVRSHRFRLLRYADGSEELYDHDHDSQEAYNLLHPTNAAVVEKFGMSDTQVEAVRSWLGQQLEKELTQRTAPPNAPASDAAHGSLAGDFNDDGRVDAADSTVWRDNLGKEVPVGTAGDGDFDGRVEEDDRNVWLNNYGRTRTPAVND